MKQTKIFLLMCFFLLVIFFICLNFKYDNLNYKPFENIPKNNISNQYVLIAINIDDTSKPYYFFYLPFVVEAWKIIGFKSVIILVSSLENNLNSFSNNDNNTLVLKTIEYLKKQEIILILVEAEKDYGKITAMVCRLFAGVIKELEDEDFVITSDSDLVPVKKSYYKFENKDDITVLNGFCCGSFKHKDKKYEMYPMGHIGMKKKNWRQMMNISKKTEINSQTVIELVRNNLGDEIVKKDNKIARGDPTWYADQTIVSVKISKYVNDLKKAKLIKKHYRGIRYDRIFSNTKLLSLISKKYDSITDFHCFHSDFMDRWKSSNELFKRLFDEKIYSFLNQYYTEFKLIFQEKKRKKNIEKNFK